MTRLAEMGLGDVSQDIGRPISGSEIMFRSGDQILLRRERGHLRNLWSKTSWQMQRLRDDVDCADEEHALRVDDSDPGLSVQLPDSMEISLTASAVRTGTRPRMAILREQGVNGQIEMAAAFDLAGFDCVDVHMSDILDGQLTLANFKGLAACGGFSYGDVLGAGEGWAKSILFSERAREIFSTFFARPDSFSLGVCNGCQMLSNLHELIPGADHWPRFIRNRSEQFEARLCLVEIEESPSILLQGMQGARLPIAVAHGEGRAEFSEGEELKVAPLVSLRFVDHHGQTTHHYPENPNGSPQGITGLTTRDGRVSIMMPHPERVFRSAQYSWHPAEWGEEAPWMNLYRNARNWVD
jgi:phosphoribosylformylglycinamidine synthase